MNTTLDGLYLDTANGAFDYYEEMPDFNQVSAREESLNELPPGTELIDIGYTPRPFQDKVHTKLRRFNVLVCHRR